MLILSRKVGERFFVELPGGRRVEVAVVDVDRGKVRLGVVAPRDVPVLRSELPGRKGGEK